MPQILMWIATALPFALLDAIWLTTMGALLYRPVLGEAMRAKPDILAALAFYVIYTLALSYFAVGRSSSSLNALLLGGFFGLAAYATYDLSNQATLQFWTWRVALIDIAWGTFASAISAYLAAEAHSFFVRLQTS